MNYELVILRGLLVASVMVCGLILGNMLGLAGAAPTFAAPTADASASTATAITAGACALPPDGVLCVASGS